MVRLNPCHTNARHKLSSRFPDLALHRSSCYAHLKSEPADESSLSVCGSVSLPKMNLLYELAKDVLTKYTDNQLKLGVSINACHKYSESSVK